MSFSPASSTPPRPAWTASRRSLPSPAPWVFALSLPSALLLPTAALTAAEQGAQATVGPPEIRDAISSHPGVVDASTVVPNLLVDLAYSGPNNFIGRDVYGDLEHCYLQADAAHMLARAATTLATRAPNLRLLAYDCLRPRRVQLQMWEVVKGTAKQGYVANPHGKTGSVHNYGCAIDLTLATSDGKPLDMGTPFDHFGPEAQPRRENRNLVAGKLSHQAHANRLLLREIMVRAGFYPLDHEWWHFNCARRSETSKRYNIVQ